MSIQKKNINLNTREKCEMEKTISLEYVINVYRKAYEDCFIWFNNELVEFKRFMDCYKTMDIAKVFTDNENHYILERDGVYYTVSTCNPEDDWEQ
ncbi:hypothetical protein C1H57_17365 [Clostridium sp. 2-1]|uniref:hypothetical protein n=1 Tax=Clostridium TaxID=1485 RepID=UPI000CDB3A60|nr:MULTISPECIES: hypothetical protein [Clostridium]MBN7576230.1 hypothetical protein [Clostridium beijerinckii]MBN7581314.1 hypothetical protein [Clostridium beijerinckii]MBN7585999.1 hypothetical protein [Clostridium beijerinckii]MBO0521934.1 hypothetical protein [Clostridium beijerinckii]POO90029.1 hypothetical protein C1H57_17365 [Clostridium sp. 2-1]